MRFWRSWFGPIWRTTDLPDSDAAMMTGAAFLKGDEKYAEEMDRDFDGRGGAVPDDQPGSAGGHLCFRGEKRDDVRRRDADAGADPGRRAGGRGRAVLPRRQRQGSQRGRGRNADGPAEGTDPDYRNAEGREEDLEGLHEPDGAAPGDERDPEHQGANHL